MDFAEIRSRKTAWNSLPVGTIRAQGNVDAHGGCLVGLCRHLLSPLEDDCCALLDLPPSLHAHSQLQNAALNRSMGPMKLYVRVARLLYSLRLLYFDVLDACTQTLGRLTAATITNERVALVDFYAEFVFGSCDAIRRTYDVIDDLMYHAQLVWSL